MTRIINIEKQIWGRRWGGKGWGGKRLGGIEIRRNRKGEKGGKGINANYVTRINQQM